MVLALLGRVPGGQGHPWGAHSLRLVRGLDHNERYVPFKKTIMLNQPSMVLLVLLRNIMFNEIKFKEKQFGDI